MKKTLLQLLPLLLIALAIPITLFLAQRQQDIRERAQETPLDATAQMVQEVEQLTLQLIQEAPQGQDSQRIAQIAQERKARMVALAQNDPQAFLRLVLPVDVRNNIPPALAGDVESEVTKEGVLTLLHQDDFDNKKSTTLYILKTDEGKLQLYTPAQFGDLQSNTRVRVTGIGIDNVVVVAKPEEHLTVLAEDAITSPTIQATSETSGNQRLAVILITFPGNTAPVLTRSEVQGILFDNSNSVNAYYREISFNRISGLSGDVFGPYTVAPPLGTYCNGDELLSNAVEAADSDVNFRNYTRVVVIFPYLSACSSWAGMGTIGYDTFSTNDGLILASISWINYHLGMHVMHVVSHELGHNFGLHHASFYNCQSRAVDGRCESVEYGDPFDVMGSAATGHFNAPHKSYLNWLTSQNVQEITADGDYVIEPIEASGSGIKMLMVPKEIAANDVVQKWYYLEYRQPIGFDSTLSGQNLFDGILVHYESDRILSYRTNILDMTPTDRSDYNGMALGLGQTYTDSITGATIRPLAKTATGIRVAVTMPQRTCIQSPPTIDIDSFSLSVKIAPGETHNFFGRIINNDNDFCTAPSTYTLSATGPSEWSIGFDNSSFTVRPGRSDFMQAGVTSPRSVTDGFYEVTLRITNTARGDSDSIALTYIVDTASITPTPVLSNADVDRDGCVGVVDFSIWRVAFQTETTAPNTYPDINGDEAIDILDFTQWFLAMRAGQNLCS